MNVTDAPPPAQGDRCCEYAGKPWNVGKIHLLHTPTEGQDLSAAYGYAPAPPPASERCEARWKYLNAGQYGPRCVEPGGHAGPHRTKRGEVWQKDPPPADRCATPICGHARKRHEAPASNYGWCRDCNCIKFTTDDPAPAPPQSAACATLLLDSQMR